MKIKKLYTLSQFIDYVVSEHQKIGYDNQEDSDNLFFIYKYNDLLKTPLKKEMFVNEIAKPDIRLVNDIYVDYKKLLKAWQEAEKKVIFIKMEAYNLEAITGTLSQLSEESNGQLRIKNIEL